MDIKVLDAKFAFDLALLHCSGIPTGFISSLGQEFVTALYEAIAEDKNSFGYVVVEDEKVLGFVAFTADLNALYKSVVLQRGLKFASMLAIKAFSLKTIKKVFETLFYPSRIKKMNLPSAELLSIVVADESQGKGLGLQLLQKGLAGCAKRGIDKVKVLVGVDNKPANELYQKCGFELVAQIENHGILSNVYVVDTAKKYTK